MLDIYPPAVWRAGCWMLVGDPEKAVHLFVDIEGLLLYTQCYEIKKAGKFISRLGEKEKIA